MNRIYKGDHQCLLAHFGGYGNGSGFGSGHGHSDGAGTGYKIGTGHGGFVIGLDRNEAHGRFIMYSSKLPFMPAEFIVERCHE